ncbi:putative metallopeptidase family M24 containing protein [Monocercomonoides exilis]|uniref:putative metallopeptidase family M24 containing protein n=1 Tax=Monocercomonoides exilis TaxID=2049356 RepID=UPI003559C6B6|nr:putative metallopeptidase family M24 containing protein [Monocercomonoides exilis]|eukprot:MONOS_14289.1-p1 / transcript=MONOS_14289.1 / gene=MONOS_14289 / organism=Monocercomonoides_exilis_PA203 / gene_product=metallopeptidase family M24 containing protein / transcript_product=metallopeptidase family M24 containing protein / location=Mono_scaffold00972:5099-9831(-) / protein_length=1109 / sequence_SO=supercontig / SO=protein_coding / is_pseudo=false
MSTPTATTSSASVLIDKNIFEHHVRTFLQHWKDNSEQYGNADIISLPPFDGDESYHLINVLQIWIFGYELPNVWITIKKDKLVVFATEKKADILEPLKNADPAQNLIEVKRVPMPSSKGRKDKDPKESEAAEQVFDEYWKAEIDSLGLSESVRVGEIPFAPKKAFAKRVQKAMGSIEKAQSVNIATGVLSLLRAKDEDEVNTIVDSGHLSWLVMDRVATRSLLDMVDEDKAKSEEDISQAISAAIEDPKPLKEQLKKEISEDEKNAAEVQFLDAVQTEKMEECYAPQIKSGNDQIRKEEAPNKEMLTFQCMRSELGVRYKGYCTNVGRTLFINNTEEQMKLYKLLLKTENFIISLLRTEGEGEGSKESTTASIGLQAEQFLRKSLIELQIVGNENKQEEKENDGELEKKANEWIRKHVDPEIGYLSGILPIDPEWKLELPSFSTASSSASASATSSSSSAAKSFPLSPSECVIVRVVFRHLETAASANKKEKKLYSLLLSDTILISANGADPVILTRSASRAPRDISFATAGEPTKPQASSSSSSSSVPSSLKGSEILKEIEKRPIPVAYKAFNSIPATIRQTIASALPGGVLGTLQGMQEKGGKPNLSRPQLSATIDRDNGVLFVPICGVPVPLHMSTIKSVSHAEENLFSSLRINLHTSGTLQSTLSLAARDGATVSPGAVQHPDKIFLAEIVYRSANKAEVVQLERQVKTMLKETRAKERADRDKSSLAKQEKLILSSDTQLPGLDRLFSRPSFKKNTVGRLECHINGLRYITNKGDEIQLPFSNIRQAFLQLAHNDLIVLIHFHLWNDIIVNKKKTRDVQFYVEVVEQSRALDARSMRSYDVDEIEEERREQEQKKRINNSFKNFARRIEQYTETLASTGGSQQILFDIPSTKLGFHGVSQKEMAFHMPTQHCLVELVTFPFTVIFLDEIQLIYFERVDFSLRNCDMVVIFKSLKRNPQSVKSIDMKKIDMIKKWLDSLHIPHYEGVRTLNWVKILSDIRADPEGFEKEGGWSFLEPDPEEEEKEVEEESEYDPNASENGDEDEEDEEGSDDASEHDSDEFSSDYVSDEEEESEFEPDEEEEEGKDWDELEEEARKADMERFGRR